MFFVLFVYSTAYNIEPCQRVAEEVPSTILPGFCFFVIQARFKSKNNSKAVVAIQFHGLVLCNIFIEKMSHFLESFIILIH